MELPHIIRLPNATHSFESGLQGSISILVRNSCGYYAYLGVSDTELNWESYNFEKFIMSYSLSRENTQLY